MNSYKIKKQRPTTIRSNKSYQGETIEQKIQRIVSNKEPISDNAPRIYTERKNGVMPEHDIRTDRWEVAVDAMDKVTASMRAKRENKPNINPKEAKEGMDKEDKEQNSGTESVEATDDKT